MVDVAIIVDASASINANEWKQFMSFGKELVSSMGISAERVFFFTKSRSMPTANAEDPCRSEGT